MDLNIPVWPQTFQAIQNVDIDLLSTLTDDKLRPILPCLVRMSLCAPLDSSERWTRERKKILQCLSGIEIVNSLVGLLSIDFHALEQDARKEQQLRSKVSGGNQSESVLISQLEHGVALEFERSDAARKLRLLLSELLFVISQMNEPRSDFYHKQSELFECSVYLEEVSDVLCIAQAELPSLLPIAEVCEALLHITNGTWLLCRLVANVPDSLDEVVRQLVSSGERQDEEKGQSRIAALHALCEMCPSQALHVRALCVEHCKLPSLAVHLTLQQDTDQSSDLLAFISGLLLGSDSNVKTWIAQYIGAGQKRKDASSGFHRLRTAILHQLAAVVPDNQQLCEEHVVRGGAFIKLYCAMKSIAAMRFNEEECRLLLQLLTSHPPYSAAGIRFVSLALCMLLAAPYLLGCIEEERHAVEWLKWLVKEGAQFEKRSGESATFCEMLLLIAIHFHSAQTTAIANLVSSTLAMKSPVKANSLARIKTIFTQEIFTEQVVTSHAVRVAVTRKLSTHTSGYLPLHCVYQLLKSRAFIKYKVPIKGWIFAQLCHCTTPLHPLIPSLIEAYVNSILVPGNKTGDQRTNEPLTEAEILSVFGGSAVARHMARRQHSCAGDLDQPGTDKSKLISQLLLVYYVLLYNDTLLAHMKNIVSHRRTVHHYSTSLMAQLPMKYLLQQAHRQQQLYAGLFAPLLRLLTTHYPHLCLVEDWMDEELSILPLAVPLHNLPSVDKLQTVLADQRAGAELVMLLEHLVSLDGSGLLPYADVIISCLHRMLQPNIKRKLIELVKIVWFKLNTVMPRKLRVMTVNSLRLSNGSETAYTETELTIDPLLVLRCHCRVYRCPPLMDILLRVLDAFLSASRTHLNSRIQTTTTEDAQGGSGGKKESMERDELKTALVAAQESAAIQLLLEACLPIAESQSTEEEEGELLSDRREVQCMICSQLHRMFIDEPNLAKLVHFQGYPSELLSITVAGIPSMHICLDFIPELISQPQLDKTMFGVELVSYLSLQYALPKSMSMAKLAVNTMATLLTVLSSEQRVSFFAPLLASVGRLSAAFPAITDDVLSLLLQLSRVANSQLANTAQARITELTAQPTCPDDVSKHTELCSVIEDTFSAVVRNTRLLQHNYPHT